MHHPIPLTILLAFVLTLAGCLDFMEAEDEPEPGDDAGTGGDGGDGDGDGTGAGDGDGDPFGNETEPYAMIEAFSADVTEGTAPANVTFTWEVDTDDEEATWALETGDGISEQGAVSDENTSYTHPYETEGNFTAVFTVHYGDSESVQQSLNLRFEAADELPEQMTFEYGPSLGCIGDLATCVSRELGPGGEEIDGFWQELDERYWGLDFTVIADSALGDTDCDAFDEDEERIDADLNGADGPCEGPLPEGTQWLFLYSYAEPALSLELVFSESE